jgi:hypothetical protein
LSLVCYFWCHWLTHSLSHWVTDWMIQVWTGIYNSLDRYIYRIFRLSIQLKSLWLSPRLNNSEHETFHWSSTLFNTTAVFTFSSAESAHMHELELHRFSCLQWMISPKILSQVSGNDLWIPLNQAWCYYTHHINWKLRNNISQQLEQVA